MAEPSSWQVYSKLLAFQSSLVITLIILLYSCSNSTDFKKVESIPLSEESLGGLNLADETSRKTLEDKFGKTISESSRDGGHEYQLCSNSSTITVLISKDNKIIKIMLMDSKNSSLTTSKGITMNSSQDDIMRAYGRNFLRKHKRNLLAGSKEHSIIYIDKYNRYTLSFNFGRENTGEVLKSIVLSRY